MIFRLKLPEAETKRELKAIDDLKNMHLKALKSGRIPSTM